LITGYSPAKARPAENRLKTRKRTAMLKNLFFIPFTSLVILDKGRLTIIFFLDY
jgi:hypothetical protein